MVEALHIIRRVDMLSIQGTVERITYRNEDNLYTVARINCEGRGPTGRGDTKLSQWLARSLLLRLGGDPPYEGRMDKSSRVWKTVQG